jgi:Lipocalin-like domain
MKRLLAVIVAGATATAFGHTALGQQQNPLLGTWTIVSVDDVRPDGSKQPLMGSSPDGMLIFDVGGQYSLQLCDSNRLKFAAKDRSKGTPDENQSAVSGCNPHWGRYSVEGKTIIFKIDHALFKNWEGTEQKRLFTLAGDELTYSIPDPSEGAVNPVVAWKRAK